MSSDFYVELIKALVALFTLMFSNTSIVEAAKKVAIMITTKFPKFNIQIKDNTSLVLAGFVAVLMGYYLKIDFVGMLGLQGVIPPELATLVIWAITWVGSSKLYDKYFKK